MEILKKETSSIVIDLLSKKKYRRSICASLMKVMNWRAKKKWICCVCFQERKTGLHEANKNKTIKKIKDEGNFPSLITNEITVKNSSHLYTHNILNSIDGLILLMKEDVYGFKVLEFQRINPLKTIDFHHRKN